MDALCGKALGEEVLKVYGRAVRNVPWSGAVWARYLRAAERAERPAAQQKELYAEAQRAGIAAPAECVEMHRARCDALWRAAAAGAHGETDVAEWRRTIEAAAAAVQQQFGPRGDPTAALELSRARIEAAHLGNMEGAREAVERALKSSGSIAAVGLACAALEVRHGSIDNARSVLVATVERCEDNPLAAFEALLDFEREHGDLKSFDAALRRTKRRTAQLHARAAAAAAKAQAAEAAAAAEKKAESGARGGGKRRRDASSDPPQPQSKRAATAGQTPKSEEGAPESERGAPKPGGGQPPVAPERGPCCVFLSNMAFAAGESEVRDFFASVGPVAEVSIALKPDGNKRGESTPRRLSPAHARSDFGPQALRRSCSRMQPRFPVHWRWTAGRCVAAPSL